MGRIFENLLLLGRPASGKSEFIDFMKRVPETDRAAKYHIGRFEELDDFPWIWQKFMEDNMWEAAGYPRRFSFGGANPGLAKEGGALFDLRNKKFNHEYAARYQHDSRFYADGTLIIEFARGGQDGYRLALQQLSPEILRCAAVCFIDVSYEESCRRNDARYQEKLKHNILAHKVPDVVMESFYRTHDWRALTGGQPSGTLAVQGVRVPFATMGNEPELTDPVQLDRRYGTALRELMRLRNECV